MLVLMNSDRETFPSMAAFGCVVNVVFDIHLPSRRSSWQGILSGDGER